MRIKILEIDTTHPQPAPGSTALAYVCSFESEIGGGQALVVPQPTAPENVLAQALSVTPDFDAAGSFQRLPAGAAPAPALIPLAEPGDFQVIGMVNSIVWLDDEMENSILEIVAGDCHISIPSEAENNLDLDYGEWVTFELKGLILWNENIKE